MSPVYVEDFGPALEAVAVARYGPMWRTLDLGKRAELKQALLDLLLPGVTVVLAEVNLQLADSEQAAERRGAVKALRSRALSAVTGDEFCQSPECAAHGCGSHVEAWLDEEATEIENGADL